MNEVSRVKVAPGLKTRGASRARRTVLLATALVLGMGNAGQTTPARAASAQDASSVDVTFYLNFHPPAVICVGESAKLSVTTLLEMSGTNASGQKFDYKDIVVPGITIEASVQDESVASVSPKQNSTGMLPNPNDLLAPGSISSASHARADVGFTILGKKPGVDNLYLTAHIPRRISAAAGTQIPASVVFRVAQCRYQVTVAELTYFTAPNLTSYLVGWTRGVMELQDKTGYSNTLRGDASADWSMSSYSALCSHEHEIPKAAAHLQGTVNTENNTLDVNVTFDPFEMTTQNCASGSSGSFPVPPVDVTVPAGGGFKNMPLAFTVGDETMHGSVSISVKAIPGN